MAGEPVVPDLSCLVTRIDLVQAALDGRKTQQGRQWRYGSPGDTFSIAGVSFELTRVVQQRLGDITEAEVRAEGFESLAVYRASLVDFWDPDGLCWLHEFHRLDHPVDRP